MVSLDVNSLLDDVLYFGYSLSKFQDLISGQIRYSIQFDSSPCKDFVLKSSLECVSLIEAWNCKVDHLKAYLSLKKSCLSDAF